MKQNLSLTYFLIFILLSFQVIQVTITTTTLTKVKITNQLQVKTKSKTGTAFEQNIDKLKQQWKQLFSAERGNSCTSETFIPDQNDDSSDPADDQNSDAVKSGWGIIRPSFRWIKKWGFGPAAYLLDFIEPVFIDDFLVEVKTIIATFNRLKKDDTNIYQDSFNMKFIAPKGNSLSTDADFKAISKKFSKAIHDLSINSCQLNLSLPQWSWYVSSDSSDIAYDVVAKYDIDGDGRLNYRELILAAIWINKKRDDLFCYNCFFLLARKIGAMFSFLDCQGKGYLTAEDLWSKLPSLVRKTGKYNIFKINTPMSIRTDAVNDFILKNGYTVDGGVTRNEFICGILLGMWDRYISEDKILEDDTRAQKRFRWANGGMSDIRANQYVLNNKNKK